MKFTKKIKKMNGVVARGYFYEELSWSHNKVPCAPTFNKWLFWTTGTSGGFLESPGNVSGLKLNITCFYLLPSCTIFKTTSKTILNANNLSLPGYVNTGT